MENTMNAYPKGGGGNVVTLNGTQTISGSKTFTKPITIENGTDTKIIFNNTDGEKFTNISFREDGESYGYITVDGRTGVTYSGFKINLPLHTPKVIIDGGKSGQFLKADGSLDSNKYWHAGNDGSGSGLDADMIDGLESGSLEQYRLTTIDCSDLDVNTWYPVTLSIATARETRIRLEGVTNCPKATWNYRSDKQLALCIDWTAVGSMWGYVGESREIHKALYGQGASPTSSDGKTIVGSIGQLTNKSWEYIFVRGGGVYNFYTSRGITPILRTEKFEDSGQSISPTTNEPSKVIETVVGQPYTSVPIQTRYAQFNDYENGVILLFKKNELNIHRMQGKFFCRFDKWASRFRNLDVDIWYSRWSETQYDYSFRIDQSGTETPWDLVECNYKGEIWYALRNTTQPAKNIWFMGTTENISFTPVVYYKANTKEILDEEVYNSIKVVNDILQRPKCGNASYMTSRVMTQEQYESLNEKDGNTFYCITE